MNSTESIKNCIEKRSEKDVNAPKHFDDCDSDFQELNNEITKVIQDQNDLELPREGHIKGHMQVDDDRLFSLHPLSPNSMKKKSCKNQDTSYQKRLKEYSRMSQGSLSTEHTAISNDKIRTPQLNDSTLGMFPFRKGIKSSSCYYSGSDAEYNQFSMSSQFDFANPLPNNNPSCCPYYMNTGYNPEGNLNFQGNPLLSSYRLPINNSCINNYYINGGTFNFNLSLNNQVNDETILNRMVSRQMSSIEKDRMINQNRQTDTSFLQFAKNKIISSNSFKSGKEFFIPKHNSPDIFKSKLERIEEYHNKIILENILKKKDKRTTVMIRNIPNKYGLSSFLEDISQEFLNKYDFVYLPIDYSNQCNLGFAFINFVDPVHIILFFERFRGKKWKRFNSEKICELAYAKIQGKKDLIAHFEKGSVLTSQTEDKRPLILETPDPLPKVEVPIAFLEAFVTLYPYSLYSAVSKDKFVIESYYNF